MAEVRNSLEPFHNFMNTVEKDPDVIVVLTDILRDLSKYTNITGEQVEFCIHHLS